MKRTRRELLALAKQYELKGYSRQDTATLNESVTAYETAMAGYLAPTAGVDVTEAFETEYIDNELTAQEEAVQQQQKETTMTNLESLKQQFQVALEAIDADQATEQTTQATSLQTVEWQATDIPMMVVTGWMWAATWAYNHRTEIGNRALRDTESLVIVFCAVASTVYFAGKAFGLLMNDLADLIESTSNKSDLDLVGDALNTVVRGFCRLTNLDVEVSYKWGYAALDTPNHSYRVEWKPRFIFCHYEF